MLEEEQQVDPGHMLACSGRDIFEQDDLSASQLVAAVNAPTPEDPVVRARTAEAEAALHLVPIPCWVSESEDQDSFFLELSSEVQDKGLVDPVDPSLSLSPVEPPLGQRGSRQLRYILALPFSLQFYF